MNETLASHGAGSPSAATTAANADREALLRTIEALERQRDTLGQSAIDLALAPLRSRLAELDGDGNARSVGRAAERKVASVLFADVAGFTEMSERLGSEATREIVNGLFDQLVPVVERYGGIVDKFIGDEIMAVFGAPQAAEHHAEHALRAALDMLPALASYNREEGHALALHVGVNTGPVIAGAVGSRARHDYSVTGDTVNVAARLEGAAHSGQIVVGPSTYRHTFRLFEFEALEPLSLKGKAHPLAAYRLVGPSRHRTHSLDGTLELPFTGRSSELETLLARARPDAQLGRGIVVVRAEPGIGKSRLVAELRERLGHETRWLEAGGREYRRDVSYAVVHELLDALVGVAEGVDREQAALAYGEYLQGLASDRPEGIAPYVLRLRGLPTGDDDERMLGTLGPDVLRQRMANAACELVRAATSDRSSVILIEDLHWTDPSSVALLRVLADSAALANVLFVLTTRPDAGVAAQWIDEASAASDRWLVVELGPLSDTASRVLLEGALSSDGSGSLSEDIRAKAQGNPLYLASFLRSLVDEGCAVIDAGKLSVTRDVGELAIPETLQAVVGTRIDRLPAEAKLTLQRASILGSVFLPHDVARISGPEGDAASVAGNMTLLCQRQLLQPDVVGRLRFVHALVRDVAYDQMLERDRRRLHGVAAQVKEDAVDDSSEADVALLAWHWERAGDRPRASSRFEQAATLAANSHANREALGYLESALRLAGPAETERISRLTECTGDVLQRLARFPDAAARFESILRHVKPPGPIDAARLQRKIARTWTPRFSPEQTNRAIEEARGLLGAHAAPEATTWWREHFAVELLAMWAAYMQNRPTEVARLAARLEPELELYGTVRERGVFHRNVVLLRLRETRFRPDAATIELAARAVAELREANDTSEICLTAFTHAFAQLWSGALEVADRSLRQVHEEALRLGDAELNMLCLVYLAVAARQLGNVSTAEAFANAAIATGRANGSPHYEGVSHGTLAWVAWRRGDGPLADRLVEAARQATIPAYPFFWLYGAVALARAVERGDIEAASANVASMIEAPRQRLDGDVQALFESALAAPSLASMQAVVDECKRIRYL